MKLKVWMVLVVGLIPAFGFSQQMEKDTIKLFILGGQSNMNGYGYFSELPDSLNTTFNDVWIFHGTPAMDGATYGGLGKWDHLKPGHGVGFGSDGKVNKPSDRFGLELSFGSTLQRLYPNEKIALIKYAKGGTSIDSIGAKYLGSWEADYQGKEGINQYDHLLATIRNAFSVRDIDGDGREDFLLPSGIIWMQGESDGNRTEEVARRYYFNLKRLMDLIRASLRIDDLPVVIGKIADSWQDDDGKVWSYGELVQYAQEKYAKTDKNATIVRDTRYYKYSDKFHYDGNGYIDLGKKFAQAIYRLNEE